MSFSRPRPGVHGVRCHAAFRRISLAVLALILATFVRGEISVAVAQAPVPAVTPAGEAPPSGSAAPAEPPAEQGGGNDEAGAQAPPELIPPYIVRVYAVRPARLWKQVLDSLEAEGFPPEVTDEKAKVVKTSFVDFKQDNYDIQVADPPPRIGGDNQILQLIKVKVGKVSLEIVVAPAPQGSELKVRARILVMGLNRAKRVRVLVDRRSTGVIESDLIHKLEARLGLQHL